MSENSINNITRVLFWYKNKPYYGKYEGKRFYNQQAESLKELFDSNEYIAKIDIQVLFDEEMKSKSSVRLNGVIMIYNDIVVFAAPELIVNYISPMSK